MWPLMTRRQCVQAHDAVREQLVEQMRDLNRIALNVAIALGLSRGRGRYSSADAIEDLRDVERWKEKLQQERESYAENRARLEVEVWRTRSERAERAFKMVENEVKRMRAWCWPSDTDPEPDADEEVPR